MLSCSARSDVPPLSGDDNDNDNTPIEDRSNMC